MNDFTKEELMNLSDAILYCRLESRREKLLLIRDKIQSMINDYCEHKWTFYISPHGNSVTCNLCNKGIQE